MTRRTAHTEIAEEYAEQPIPKLDRRLDALVSLIDATSSVDTKRVLARHLLGAFEELVEQGRMSAFSSGEADAASSEALFRALDELADLGFASLSFQGYGLTELGRQRAAQTADASMDDIAAAWRI